MIRIVGKVYPFKDTLGWSNTKGMWMIKKVVGFDKLNRPKTEHIGAYFSKEDDAIEYCHFWNRKYFKEVQ